MCPVWPRRTHQQQQQDRSEIQMESRVDGCWQGPSLYTSFIKFRPRDAAGLPGPFQIVILAKKNNNTHLGSNHLSLYLNGHLHIARWRANGKRWRREKWWRIGRAVIGRTRKQHLGTPIGLSSVSFLRLPRNAPSKLIRSRVGVVVTRFQQTVKKNIKSVRIFTGRMSSHWTLAKLGSLVSFSSWMVPCKNRKTAAVRTSRPPIQSAVLVHIVTSIDGAETQQFHFFLLKYQKTFLLLLR